MISREMKVNILKLLRKNLNVSFAYLLEEDNELVVAFSPAPPFLDSYKLTELQLRKLCGESSFIVDFAEMDTDTAIEVFYEGELLFCKSREKLANMHKAFLEDFKLHSQTNKLLMNRIHTSGSAYLC